MRAVVDKGTAGVESSSVSTSLCWRFSIPYSIEETSYIVSFLIGDMEAAILGMIAASIAITKSIIDFTNHVSETIKSRGENRKEYTDLRLFVRTATQTLSMTQAHVENGLVDKKLYAVLHAVMKQLKDKLNELDSIIGKVLPTSKSKIFQEIFASKGDKDKVKKLMKEVRRWSDLMIWCHYGAPTSQPQMKSMMTTMANHWHNSNTLPRMTTHSARLVQPQLDENTRAMELKFEYANDKMEAARKLIPRDPKTAATMYNEVIQLFESLAPSDAATSVRIFRGLTATNLRLVQLHTDATRPGDQVAEKVQKTAHFMSQALLFNAKAFAQAMESTRFGDRWRSMLDLGMIKATQAAQVIYGPGEQRTSLEVMQLRYEAYDLFSCVVEELEPECRNTDEHGLLATALLECARVLEKLHSTTTPPRRGYRELKDPASLLHLASEILQTGKAVPEDMQEVNSKQRLEAIEEKVQARLARISHTN